MAKVRWSDGIGGNSNQSSYNGNGNKISYSYLLFQGFFLGIFPFSVFDFFSFFILTLILFLFFFPISPFFAFLVYNFDCARYGKIEVWFVPVLIKVEFW